VRVSQEAEDFFENWGVLRAAVEAGASDLHLVDNSRPMARIRGELVPIDDVVLGTEHMYHLLKFLTEGPMMAKFYEPELLEDLDHTVEFGSLDRRFRVNIFRQNDGVSIVMRTLSQDVRDFERLGIPAGFARVADERSGLVLVTGVTGSGKSTTLASIIELINTRYRRHVITIEDPIEVVFKNRLSLIEQREVGSHTASFHDALRSALRQAPDVVLVGEIRDGETARMALRAAQVGVLVLATLHTRSATESVGRLVNLFDDSIRMGARQQIADCLRATLCQMLIPARDRKSMVPCCELMWGTTAVRHLIRDDKTYLLHSLMEIASKDGMITMEQSLLRAFREGKISLESAYDYANDKPTFLSQLEPNLHKELQIHWETDVELKRLEALRETAKRQSNIRNQ
jgi:twitching motility protein PilT